MPSEQRSRGQQDTTYPLKHRVRQIFIFSAAETGYPGKPPMSFNERAKHQHPALAGACGSNPEPGFLNPKPPSLVQGILLFRQVSSCAFNSTICMKRSHPAVKTAKPSHFILCHNLVNMKYIEMQEAFCCLLAEADQYLLSQLALLQFAADKLLG